MIGDTGLAQNIKHKENKNKSLPEMYKEKVTRKCQTLKYLFFILSIDVKYWNKFSALLILKSRWTLLRMQIEKNYKNTLPFQHHLPPILNYAHQLHSNNVCHKTVSNHSSEQSCGILPDHKSFRNPVLQMPSFLSISYSLLLWSTPKTIQLQALHSFVLFLLDSLPELFPHQTSSPTHPTLFYFSVCFFNPWRLMCENQIFSDVWSSFVA